MQVDDKYKPIPNCIGYYITDNGVVLSVKQSNRYPNGKILSHTIDRLGYVKVGLQINNVHTMVLLHRLVAETFIPDKSTFKSMPDENRDDINLDSLEVNHKDENKLNNNVNNLEWCTHKYNSNYGTRTERIIPQTIDKTRTPIDQYDHNWNLIKEWYSTNEAARNLNIIQQNITKCCQGKRYHAGGYRWKYHNENEKRGG